FALSPSKTASPLIPTPCGRQTPILTMASTSSSKPHKQTLPPVIGTTKTRTFLQPSSSSKTTKFTSENTFITTKTLPSSITASTTDAKKTGISPASPKEESPSSRIPTPTPLAYLKSSKNMPTPLEKRSCSAKKSTTITHLVNAPNKTSMTAKDNTSIRFIG